MLTAQSASLSPRHMIWYVSKTHYIYSISPAITRTLSWLSSESSLTLICTHAPLLSANERIVAPRVQNDG